MKLSDIVDHDHLPSFCSYLQQVFTYYFPPQVSFGQCPICLEDMWSAARITACAHIFHAHCLRKSLEVVGDACPMCRKPILANLYHEEQEMDYSEAAYWQQHIQ